MQPRSELRQERNVSRVPEWLTTRKGPERELEPDGRVKARQVTDGGPADQATLQSTDRRFGEPARSGDRGHAEAPIPPGRTDLPTCLGKERRRSLPGEIDRSLSGRHGLSLAHRAYPAIYGAIRLGPGIVRPAIGRSLLAWQELPLALLWEQVTLRVVRLRA